MIVFDLIKAKKTGVEYKMSKPFFEDYLYHKNALPIDVSVYKRNFVPQLLLPLAYNNETAFYLGNKMLQQYELSTPNHNRLSMHGLLDSCPAMKTYSEDIAHWRRNLIDPLLTGFEYLSDLGFLQSYFFTIKKKPICVDELRKLSHEDFLKAVVQFELQKQGNLEKIFEIFRHEGVSGSRMAVLYRIITNDLILKMRNAAPYERDEKVPLSFFELDVVNYVLLGNEFNSEMPERLVAILTQALEDYKEYKKCLFVPVDQLKVAVDAVDQYIPTSISNEKALGIARFSPFQFKVVNTSRYGEVVYLAESRKREVYLAARIVQLSQAEPLKRYQEQDIVDAIDAYNKTASPRLSDEQFSVVKNVLQDKLAVITGGPGTGKSTIVRAIVSVLNGLDPKSKVTCVAPTGMAAYKLEQSAGKRAQTIHSALFSKKISPDRPIDLLIVDESSMIDLEILETLMNRLR
jgi:exodeoxyribonuclease V alpha subunit